MRVCNEPNCPELTDAGKCQIHKRERWKRTNASRPSPREQGYNAEWATTRRLFLAAFPICQWHEGCLTLAKEVHHLDGKGPKGPRGHDWGNLQGLCKPHHSHITGKEHGFGSHHQGHHR